MDGADFCLGILMGILLSIGLAFVLFLLWKPRSNIPLDRIDKLDPTKLAVTRTRAVISADLPESTSPKLEEFAVTSKPRHIPWSRRKKELEAAARQKRRQIEEFREQA